MTSIPERPSLIELVRDVGTLIGGVRIYRDAEITLRTFDPNSLRPTAKYVVTTNLDFVADMAAELHRSGIDIFHLDELFEGSGYTIAPPIVEFSDGVPAIVDGIHRVHLARALGRTVSVVYIKGVDPNYPIISTPVEWSDVIEYAVKPKESHLLRNVRPGISDTSDGLKKYYRDLRRFGSTGRRPSQHQLT